MTRRVGVALLITELNVGGAERALTNLAIGLDSSEFQVEVISLAPRPEPGRASLVEEIERAGVPIHFLGARSLWQLPAVVHRLNKQLRRQQPAVLLSFLYHANVVGGLAARLSRSPPAHVASVRVAEPSGRRLRIERPFLRRANAVTCVSEMLATHVAKRQQIAPEKIVVIPNGIEASRFDGTLPADLAALGIGAERRLLTVVSRLEPQKGIDWLLSDIDALLERLPDHDLLIVGEGSQRTRLVALASAAASANRIHFAGQRPDVGAVLKRSDLLLLPSRYEGMPNVLLEAMAAGLPIVATAVEGILELLGHDDNRQVTHASVVSCFYDKTYRLATDEEKRQEIGRSNRTRVLESFTLERMITGFANVIRAASTPLEQKR